MNNLASTLRAQGDHAGARRLQERVLEVRTRAGRGAPGHADGDEQSGLDTQGARRSRGCAAAPGAGAGGEDARAGRGAPGHADGDEQSGGDALVRKAITPVRGGSRSGCWRRGRRVLGEEHPDTLTSMNNLAETLRAQGDHDGARQLQERVLEVRTRVLGEEHPAHADIDEQSGRDTLRRKAISQGRGGSRSGCWR